MIDIREYGVEISNLIKTFRLKADGSDAVAAIDGIDLRVNPGELFVLLGPSGCGKTTLLRCVAGLEQPDDGDVRLGGRQVFSARTGHSVPAQDRGVGMVFQNFALYPHMSVAENVGFGLRTRKVPHAEAQQRVSEALRLVDMAEYATRRPANLSGGQQQRVAVARAIAGNPRILLFDEPLSNLDPLLRSSVRTELRQLIRRLGITSLFVTHDQEEAMILGDRVAVLNRGRIEQIGTPEEVYRRPETIFVAGFTGRPRTNLIETVIDEFEGRLIMVPIESQAETLAAPEELREFRNQRVTVHVRPEDIELTNDGAGATTKLSVMNVMPEGSHSYVYFSLGGSYEPLLVRTGAGDVSKDAIGSEVGIRFRKGTVYSPDSGYRIGEFGP